VTSEQLDGLVRIALDPDAPVHERQRAGALAGEEIHRLEDLADGWLHPRRWEMFEASCGYFKQLDKQLARERFF
jgi:hypothetical protein